MKKFKRAVVQGGTLQGARYSDVSEQDLRKSARSYRGDARFRQFCKQWVASQIVAPESLVQGTKQLGQPDVLANASWWSKLKTLTLTNCKQFLSERFKGRWWTFLTLLCLVLVVVSRPAFGKLCGRVIGLSVRVFIKRSMGLLLTVLDSILEEAVEQVEQALLPPPSVFNTDGTANTKTSPAGQHSTSLQLMLHVVCLIVGSFLGRMISNAPVPARNSP